MSRASLLARRSAAQRGLLALVWLLVAAAAGTTGLTIGYVQAAATEGARAGIAAGGPSGGALVVTTRLADDRADAALQDTRVRSAVADVLAGVPYAVAYDIRTEPLRTVRGPEPEPEPGAGPGSGTDGPDLGRWVVASLPSASREAAYGGAPADGVALAEGAWPAAADEAALQADAAEAAGLAVGDRLRLGADSEDPASGVVVTISGTWRVADAADPRWFGDPLTLTGADGDARGPVVTSADTIGALDTDPFARWTLVPDVAALRPGDLAPLAGAAEALDGRLGDDDAVAVRGLRVLGTLGDAASSTGAALQAADAVALVPLLLLVLVGGVALVQVARLLAATRASEVALLVSRGASPSTVTAGSAVEAALLGTTAAVAGAAGAALLLGTLAPGAAASGTPVVVAVATAVAATAVLTVVAGLQVRAAARRQVGDRSGRARTVAALGTVVLTVAAAGVSLAQLRRHGSPLVTTPDGLRTDAVSAAAPALVLAALAVATMAVLGPATRAWAGATARTRGAVGVLAARQVARRLVVYVVPVVLLVLASGSATLAGAYAGTSDRLQTDVATLRNGTDVRVELPGAVAADLAPFAGLDGVVAAAPVLSATAYADGDPVELLAIPGDAVGQVVRAPAGVLDPAAVAASLATETFPDAPVLPAGARQVTATVAARITPVDENLQPFADLFSMFSPDILGFWETGVSLRAGLQLVEAAGTVVSLPLGELDADLDRDGDGARPVGAEPVSYDLTADLPPGEWRVAGIDLAVGGTWVTLQTELSVAGLAADGVPIALDQDWRHSPEITGPSYTWEDSGRPTLEIASQFGGDGLSARYLPGEPRGPVPAVLTTGLLERFGIAEGDVLDLTVAGSVVPVEVTGTVGTLPGALAPYAALLDRAALAEVLVRVRDEALPANEVWLAAAPPDGEPTPGQVEALAERAREAAGTVLATARGEAVVTTPGYDVTVDAAAPVRVAFWLAAAGSVALALAGVLAVAVATVRARRGEVVALRAVGLGPGAQARGRVAELLTVGAAAVLVGALAGWLVAALAVPRLAVATLSGLDAVPTAALTVPLAGTGVVLAAAVVGLAVVAAGIGARVAAQVRDTGFREEVR